MSFPQFNQSSLFVGFDSPEVQNSIQSAPPNVPLDPLLQKQITRVTNPLDQYGLVNAGQTTYSPGTVGNTVTGALDNLNPLSGIQDTINSNVPNYIVGAIGIFLVFVGITTLAAPAAKAVSAVV